MSVAPNPCSPGCRPRQSLLTALVCGAMLAVTVMGVVLFQRSRVPGPPAPERTEAELIRRDGVLMEKAGSHPFSGWLVERQPAGSLRSRSWISNGILSGVSEGWHTNGVLLIREQFVAGLSEGPVTRWRDDGSKLSEGVARAGKLEGVFRRWHANGQLAEEVTLRAGEPQGLSRAWYPGGSLKAEVQLDGGNVVAERFWKDGEKDGQSMASATLSHP